MTTLESTANKEPKRAVQYSLSKGEDRCGHCRFFEREAPNHCTKVQGTIDAKYWCIRYKVGSEDFDLDEPAPDIQAQRNMRSYNRAIKMGIKPETAAKMYGVTTFPDDADVLS